MILKIFNRPEVLENPLRKTQPKKAQASRKQAPIGPTTTPLDEVDVAGDAKPRASLPDNSNPLMRGMDKVADAIFSRRTKSSREAEEQAPDARVDAGKADSAREPYPDLGSVIALVSGENIDPALTQRFIAKLVHDDERFISLRTDPRCAVPEGSLTPEENKIFQTMHKKITPELVSIIPRASDTSRLLINGKEVLYTQDFGHMEGEGTNFTQGAGTLDSESIKLDHLARHGMKREYNANLGAIKQDGKMLLVRSARTDTAKKLEELLLFGAANAAPSQLHPTEHPGLVEYRGAIISAMDLGAVKSTATRFMRAGTGKAEKGENERDFLAAQQEAVAELFGAAPYIERQIDGKAVRLGRPPLLNLTLSGQAKKPDNIRLSRQYNEGAAHMLFIELANIWQKQDRGTDGLTRRMAACQTDAQRRDLLKNLKPEQYMHLKTDNPDRLMALDFLKLTLTGQDLEGAKQLDALAPGRDLAQLNHLLKEIGRTPHVQCKSGQDRTLSLVGMIMAADMFEKIHKFTYNPKVVENDPSLGSSWSLLFTQAANDMGKGPIKLVRRALGKAKWGIKELGKGSHAVAAKYYLPYNSAIGQNVKLKNKF